MPGSLKTINFLKFAGNFQDFLGYLEVYKSEICLKFVWVQILTNLSVHLSIWYSPGILTLEFN